MNNKMWFKTKFHFFLTSEGIITASLISGFQSSMAPILCGNESEDGLVS